MPAGAAAPEGFAIAMRRSVDEYKLIRLQERVGILLPCSCSGRGRELAGKGQLLRRSGAPVAKTVDALDSLRRAGQTDHIGAIKHRRCTIEDKRVIHEK